MQDEILKLVLLAMQDGASLSRKVLVLYIVQKIECRYPKLTSKTAIGHVVQLLYRASCFLVEKKNGESSLMQLRSHLRTYDQLRNAHDREIVQIAREAGLSFISPELWSNLLFGDVHHENYMMNILIQNLMIFNHKAIEDFFSDKICKSSIKYLISDIEYVLQGDAGQLQTCLLNLDRIVRQYLGAVHGLVSATTGTGAAGGSSNGGSGSEPRNKCDRYKTSMCKDGTCSRSTLRASHCHYAHDKHEIELYKNNKKKSFDVRNIPELEILRHTISVICHKQAYREQDVDTAVTTDDNISVSDISINNNAGDKICSEVINAEYQNFPMASLQQEGYHPEMQPPTYSMQIMPFDTDCSSIQQITSEDSDGALRLKSLLLTDTTSGTLAVQIPNISLLQPVPLTTHLQPIIAPGDGMMATFIRPPNHPAQPPHIDTIDLSPVIMQQDPRLHSYHHHQHHQHQHQRYANQLSTSRTFPPPPPSLDMVMTSPANSSSPHHMTVRNSCVIDMKLMTDTSASNTVVTLSQMSLHPSVTSPAAPANIMPPSLAAIVSPLHGIVHTAIVPNRGIRSLVTGYSMMGPPPPPHQRIDQRRLTSSPLRIPHIPHIPQPHVVVRPPRMVTRQDHQYQRIVNQQSAVPLSTPPPPVHQHHNYSVPPPVSPPSPVISQDTPEPYSLHHTIGSGASVPMEQEEPEPDIQPLPSSLTPPQQLFQHHEPPTTPPDVGPDALPAASPSSEPPPVTPCRPYIRLDDVIDHSWDFNVTANHRASQGRRTCSLRHVHVQEETVQCLRDQLYPIENIELNDENVNLLENESVFKIYENSLHVPNQDIIEKVNTLFFQRNLIIEKINNSHTNIKDKLQRDDFVPFQRNVISKYGPISRNALINQSTTSIFTSSNFNQPITSEVNSVTPLKRPYTSSLKNFSIIETVNSTKSLYTENRAYRDCKGIKSEYEDNSLSNMYSLSSALKLKANENAECVIKDKIFSVESQVFRLQDPNESENQFLLKALGSIENEIRNLTKT